MYRFKFTILVLAGLSLLCACPSCDKVPNDGVPFYIAIDSPTVVDDSGQLGSTSQRIVDVQAEFGNHNLGTYEMPVNIPVLAKGDVTFLFTAGILDNGIVSARVPYPFLRFDSFTVRGAVPGRVYHYKPAYHYYAGIQHYITDFEGANPYDSITKISKPNPDPESTVYEGNAGGVMNMSATDTATIAQLHDAVPIVANARQVYIEMNYKMSKQPEIYTTVGVAAIDASGVLTTYPLTILKPRLTWNKIYFNISNFVGQNAGSKFKIYFINNKLSGTAGSVYVDNIKILYFN
jgi:hypothetical protein